jgi:hypothetical protein
MYVGNLCLVFSHHVLFFIIINVCINFVHLVHGFMSKSFFWIKTVLSINGHEFSLLTGASGMFFQ